MSSPRRTEEDSAAELTRLGADDEMLAATLDVYRELDLAEQLQRLIDHCVCWSGAGSGFALGPGEARRTWSPFVGTVAKDDPRRASLGRIDPVRLRGILEEGDRAFSGLGPFGGDSIGWPGPLPESSVAIPVAGRNDEWAAVLLLLFDRGRPPEKAVRRLEGFVRTVEPAVRNALKVAAIRELVIKDDTAHCFNRRYFEACLPEELARASRFHASLSLIFLDMDNLKQVNNDHGHAMGSRTLLEVSRRVRKKIRRFDKLFRFGGDEFCIVLPETEWHGAMEVAERVRDAIASQPFLVRELGDPSGVRMTASLGIASFPLHARTKQELIELADRAMQRIKGGTKNSIGVADIVGEIHGS